MTTASANSTRTQTNKASSAASTPEEAFAAVLPSHDVHNHTVACGHAEPDATLLNLLTRAGEIGLNCLGISEHVSRPEHRACITALQQELAALPRMRAEIIIGAEMDVDPTDPQGRMVAEDLRCDYIILSAHGFPQIDLKLPQSDLLLSHKLQMRRLADRWLGWFGNAVRRGGYEIIGHPLRDPMAMGILDLKDRLQFRMAVRTLLPAIEHQAAFELNDAFIRALLACNMVEPYARLVQELRDKGMKFCRGSDSHGVRRLGMCEGISIIASKAKLLPEDFIEIDRLVGRHR